MRRPLEASRDVAAAIADMPEEARLRALSDLLGVPDGLVGCAKTAALHMNAEVVTLLRERRAVPMVVRA